MGGPPGATVRSRRLLRSSLLLAVVVLLLVASSSLEPAGASRPPDRGNRAGHDDHTGRGHAWAWGLHRCELDRTHPPAHAEALGLRRCDRTPTRPEVDGPPAPERPAHPAQPEHTASTPPTPPGKPAIEPPATEGAPAPAASREVEVLGSETERPSATSPAAPRDAARPGAVTDAPRNQGDDGGADTEVAAPWRAPAVGRLAVETPNAIPAGRAVLPVLLLVPVLLGALVFVVGRRRDPKLAQSADDPGFRDFGSG